ncbi:MAG: hypothetical protein ACTSXC_07730 [Candidatus Freyarchaeota archaeon]
MNEDNGLIDVLVEARNALLRLVNVINQYIELKAPTPVKVETLKEKLPQKLADLLSFEEGGEYIIIRPRRFLGSENFAKIAGIVKEHGGEYVSAGKQSHFRIPRKTGR